MYNAYLATRQKSHGARKQNDSPATAGMAKAPAGGLKSSEELKTLGQRNGWTARELSMREVNAMSADEVLWHETFNRKSFDDAFARAESQRVDREQQALWDIREKWAGKLGVTAQEADQARRAGATFAERFPTFERIESNALAICQYMADHDLDPKQVSSYVTAFNTLVEAGRMNLAPVQSAEEFLSDHPELRDSRTPPLIQARKAKAASTQELFEKAAAATTQSTITTLVDYPSEPSGYPPAPTKYSFRKLLDSLDAEAYRKRINDDPAFAAAVDKLQNGI